MLSGETAGGSFPLQAVTMMAHICKEAEAVLDYKSLYLAVRGSTISSMGRMQTAEAIASSAVKTALDMNAKMLVVLTESGNTARLVAKYRPTQPILVLRRLRRGPCAVGRGGSACRRRNLLQPLHGLLLH